MSEATMASAHMALRILAGATASELEEGLRWMTEQRDRVAGQVPRKEAADGAPR